MVSYYIILHNYALIMQTFVYVIIKNNELLKNM